MRDRRAGRFPIRNRGLQTPSIDVADADGSSQENAFMLEVLHALKGQ